MYACMFVCMTEYNI